MLLPLSVSFPSFWTKSLDSRPYLKSDKFARLVTYAVQALHVGSWLCIVGADGGARPRRRGRPCCRGLVPYGDDGRPRASRRCRARDRLLPVRFKARGARVA